MTMKALLYFACSSLTTCGLRLSRQDQYFGPPLQPWPTSTWLVYFILQNFNFVQQFINKSGYFILGFLMGWLCFPHQSHSSSCPDIDDHWKILAQNLRGLQHTLLRRYNFVHADFFCWIPAGAELRAYVGMCPKFSITVI